MAPAAVEPFTSPKGREYRLIPTTERGENEESPARLTSSANSSDPDDFAGVKRAAAKTSVSEQPTTEYETLEKLLGDLPGDEAMRNHQPPIATSPSSGRVAEEDRNVTVRAWLYALKKEKDNDFHLIIGTDPNANAIQYLTAEISGLPNDPATRMQLAVPRQALKDFLHEKHKTVGDRFVRISPPVPVVVSGSLFFDIHHSVGEVGVKTAPKRIPTTVWEIHPVTRIIFDP